MLSWGAKDGGGWSWAFLYFLPWGRKQHSLLKCAWALLFLHGSPDWGTSPGLQLPTRSSPNSVAQHTLHAHITNEQSLKLLMVLEWTTPFSTLVPCWTISLSGISQPGTWLTLRIQLPATGLLGFTAVFAHYPCTQRTNARIVSPKPDPAWSSSELIFNKSTLNECMKTPERFKKNSALGGGGCQSFLLMQDEMEWEHHGNGLSLSRYRIWYRWTPACNELMNTQLIHPKPSHMMSFRNMSRM